MEVSGYIQFIEADESEMNELSILAREIWPITFQEILSPEQIEYMLDWMYNPKTLMDQMKQGHQFYFLKDGNVKIGFVGIEKNYPEAGLLRIHKLYLKPVYQGKGIGKYMLDKIEEIARKKNMNGLHLNVNRFNDAYKFYKHCGFKTLKEEDIDIGNGFLMEDFNMLKKL
jgi:GNAT superfamily N-acetyltransferase